jgi:hypothetical protein
MDHKEVELLDQRVAFIELAVHIRPVVRLCTTNSGPGFAARPQREPHPIPAEHPYCLTMKSYHRTLDAASIFWYATISSMKRLHCSSPERFSPDLGVLIK